MYGGLRWVEKKTENTRRAGMPWRKRWRRRDFTAGQRWLEVLDRCRDSEERAWLAARRSQCLENARKPEPAAEFFEDVYQAASDTQKRMGIHAQNRFRRYLSAGESRKKPTC